MLRTWIEKGSKVTAPMLRRVKAINLLGAGVQLSEPAPDLSFARAHDEWELRHEIYLLPVRKPTAQRTASGAWES